MNEIATPANIFSKAGEFQSRTGEGYSVDKYDSWHVARGVYSSFSDINIINNIRCDIMHGINCVINMAIFEGVIYNM